MIAQVRKWRHLVRSYRPGGAGYGRSTLPQGKAVVVYVPSVEGLRGHDPGPSGNNCVQRCRGSGRQHESGARRGMGPRDTDLMGAALLLAFDAGGHITGQAVLVDGGANFI